ncbi:hypothetical protein JB92DRAFT_2765256 [Gautieria morchelliformis]|nr:hypothetical protein JB92DRAFT_2765256 [Gautieria morchelliformis]
MSHIISEIVKLTVEPGFSLDSPAFMKLRKSAVQGGVKEQYYGFDTKVPTTLFWVIQWPGDINPAEYKGSDPSENFRESLKALDAKSEPISHYLPFDSAEKPRPALTAPLCQLCALHLGPSAKREEIADSLHKTFTDCYYTKGFTGGYWSTATDDDNWCVYYLGWETEEFHDEYAKTDLYALEINNLVPHTDSSFTHYIVATQELN